MTRSDDEVGPAAHNSDHIQPLRILMVEDNPGDTRLVREAMREHKIHNELRDVTSAEEALELLAEGNDLPHLILLDLHLPGMSGQELLRRLKSDPRLRLIPVVVLTSSMAESDILTSYPLHANCCVTKPVNLDQFLTVVQSIDRFWLSLVTLPPPPTG